MIELGKSTEETEMFNDLYLLPGSEELSREYNDLASYYSDFHKDLYGYRARNIIGCADRFGGHNEMVEGMSHLRRLMDGLKASFDAMKATDTGRAQLRAEGWVV